MADTSIQLGSTCGYLGLVGQTAGTLPSPIAGSRAVKHAPHVARLLVEEPDALIVHVRICGRPGVVTPLADPTAAGMNFAKIVLFN